MKKRVLAMLLAMAMLVVVFAGCSSGSTPASSAAGSEASSEASSEEPVDDGGDAAGVGEGPVVEIWECQWGTEAYEATLQKLAQQATEANIDGRGIKVEVSMVSWDNYYDTFLTAVTSGTAPDIACEASTGPIMYAQMDEALDLMPVYDAWKAEGNDILNQIPQEAFDYFTYEGFLTGLPFAVDGGGLIYNKALLEEAGVEVPTTWEEMGEVCAKLLEVFPDKVPIAMPCGTPADVTSCLDMMSHANDAYIVTANFKSGLLEDNFIHILELFKDFYDKGYIGAGSSTYSSADIQRMFLAEETVFTRSSAPTFVLGTDMEEKTGILKPMAGPDTDHGWGTASFQAFHAFAQTEDAEATLSTLKWWLENNLISWSEGGSGTIPARADYVQEVYGSNPLLSEFAGLLGDSDVYHPYVYPLSGLYPFHTVLDAEATAAVALQMILTGSDAQSAAEACDAAVTEVLTDAGY